MTSLNRFVAAFIHDSLFKPWTNKVLKDFSDDYDDADPGETDKQEKDVDQKN